MPDLRPAETSAATQRGLSVRVLTRLRQQNLLDLVSGDVDLIAVRCFLSDSRCAEIITQLSGELTPPLGPDVFYQRIGEPLGEAAWNAQRLESYQREEADFAKKLAFAFAGGISPLDALSSTLHEIWPWGVEPPRCGVVSLKPGIVRSFLNGGHALPHTDRHPFSDVVSQIAANIFVEVSELGGQIKLWTCAEAAVATGLPDIVFSPQRGDLVLFRASCVHAVSPVAAGRRTTVSTFIGWRGPKAPVYVWG